MVWYDAVYYSIATVCFATFCAPCLLHQNVWMSNCKCTILLINLAPKYTIFPKRIFQPQNKHRFLVADTKEALSVRPSVHRSVGPLFCPSTRESQCRERISLLQRVVVASLVKEQHSSFKLMLVFLSWKIIFLKMVLGYLLILLWRDFCRLV